jgi:hypothetical protein
VAVGDLPAIDGVVGGRRASDFLGEEVKGRQADGRWRRTLVSESQPNRRIAILQWAIPAQTAKQPKYVSYNVDIVSCHVTLRNGKNVLVVYYRLSVTWILPRVAP